MKLVVKIDSPNIKLSHFSQWHCYLQWLRWRCRLEAI